MPKKRYGELFYRKSHKGLKIKMTYDRFDEIDRLHRTVKGNDGGLNEVIHNGDNGKKGLQLPTEEQLTFFILKNSFEIGNAKKTSEWLGSEVEKNKKEVL